MTYYLSSVNFTAQDDIIPQFGPEALWNDGEAYSLAGNDKIMGKAYYDYHPNGSGLFNNYNGTIDTGDGRDTITGIAWSDYGGSSIYNLGSIKTGNDADYISTYGELEIYNNPTHYGSLENYGMVSLGDGNDMLDAMVYVAYNSAIRNSGTIEAGNGDDIIVSNTTIYNVGFINTGNGNDALMALTNSYGGFEGSGNVFLGDGEDYLRGFGRGYYDGGNDQDSLELTSGSYTIGIGGAGVSFSKNGDVDEKTMQTVGFEKLIVYGTTYDFTSFYDGLTISV